MRCRFPGRGRFRARFRAEGIRGDRGTATAELAIALPAVVLVLACCLSGFRVAGEQLRLQDAAAASARAAARGDGMGIASQLAPAASAAQWADGDLVCVKLSAASALLFGLPVQLSASSCALAGGQ